MGRLLERTSKKRTSPSPSRRLSMTSTAPPGIASSEQSSDPTSLMRSDSFISTLARRPFSSSKPVKRHLLPLSIKRLKEKQLLPEHHHSDASTARAPRLSKLMKHHDIVTPLLHTSMQTSVIQFADLKCRALCRDVRVLKLDVTQIV